VNQPGGFSFTRLWLHQSKDMVDNEIDIFTAAH
jgi:hypothetical protein